MALHAPIPLPDRVVLVDDDPDLRAALAFALEVDGFSVSAFPDAESLLRQEIDDGAVLVLDYRLPGSNGLDLLEALRSQGAITPAVIITSQPDPMLKFRAAELGARVVEKPLLGDELVDAVRRLSRLNARALERAG